jgi:DNA-binding response OmpR family regulator
MRKLKILVIDDEKVISDTVTLILQSRNYEVITASNGAEGITMAKSEHPDLILLDVMMPVMNGHDACAKLKEDKSTKKIPILMLTGQAERDAVTKAHLTGANDYVLKPFTMATLLAKINQQFEQSQRMPKYRKLSWWRKLFSKIIGKNNLYI